MKHSYTRLLNVDLVALSLLFLKAFVLSLILAPASAQLNNAQIANESSQAPREANASKNSKSEGKRLRKPNWKGITALAVSPNGKLVGSAGSDSTVRIWNVADEELIAVNGHGGTAATDVAFGADGKYLISVGRDTGVRFWNVKTGKQSQVLFGHEHPIRTVTVSQKW